MTLRRWKADWLTKEPVNRDWLTSEKGNQIRNFRQNVNCLHVISYGGLPIAKIGLAPGGQTVGDYRRAGHGFRAGYEARAVRGFLWICFLVRVML
jgi:hypothetical protein